MASRHRHRHREDTGPTFAIMADGFLWLLLVVVTVLMCASPAIRGAKGLDVNAVEAERVRLVQEVTDLNVKLQAIGQDEATARQKLTDLTNLTARSATEGAAAVAAIQKQLDTARADLTSADAANAALTAARGELATRLAAVERALAVARADLTAPRPPDPAVPALAAATDQLKREGERAARLQQQLDAAQRDRERLKKLAAEAGVHAADAIRRRVPAELLGVNGAARRFVFVIDHSSSMTDDGKWGATVERIASWLTLFPVDEAALVAFSTGTEIYPVDGSWKDVRQAGTAPLVEQLGKWKPDGMTDTRAALDRAYHYPGADAIVLFTDGHPELPGDRVDHRPTTLRNMRDVTDLVAAHGTTIPIICVGVGKYKENDDFAKFLLDVATLSGGTFVAR